MKTSLAKIIIISALFVPTILTVTVLDIAVQAAECDCEGCKWRDGDDDTPTACSTVTQPNLKCRRGYYEKKFKKDYNFGEFTYQDGEKMYKEYDCSDAIGEGKDCGPPPSGFNDCNPVPSGCSYTQDSGDDVPTECSDSPC